MRRALALPLTHLLSLLVSVVLSAAALGGTGAGNEFEHFVNKAFDFHIAKPKTWTCQGCGTPIGSEGGNGTDWKLVAPEGTSWMTVKFLAGFPADDEDQLKAEISARHPGTQWSDFGRGEFVGFTSSPLGDAAKDAVEYYLVARQQVIMIEWQSDGAHPGRVVELLNVRRSIDRASQPPRIKKITSAPVESFRIGDKACLYVYMDDLRGNFTDSDLLALEIEGAPDHYSFKEIRWVPELGAFEACFKVTSAFGPTGLRIRRLTIGEDLNFECEAKATAEYQLECVMSRYPQPPIKQIVVPQIGPVTAGPADRSGPVIQAVELDPASRRIRIAATDPSGVHIASIDLGGQKIIAYPDQLRTGGWIDLDPYLHEGWNIIETVVVFDANGYPTGLRVRQSTVPAEGETYEIVPWEGAPSLSQIPVVAYLKTGESQ